MAKDPGKRAKRWIIFIAVIAFLAILLFVLSDFLTDLIWFGEVGYTSVFLTELFTKLKIGIPGFIIFATLGYVVLATLKRSFLKKNEFELKAEDKGKIKKSMIAISAALGLFIAIFLVSNLWFDFLRFINASEFGIEDPLFGNDVGFYMFKYDFLSGLADSAIAIVLAYIAATILLYSILVGFAKPTVERGTASEVEEDPESGKVAFRFDPSAGGNFKQKMKAILGVALNEMLTLGVLFFLFVSFRLYLEQFDVLYDSTGLFYGAGFVEVNVKLVVYRILMVLAIVAALMLIIAAKKKSIKWAVIVPLAMLVVSLLGTGVHALVQNFVVEPDELSKERKYIERNIKYTRLAYDLDDVSIQDFVPESDLTKEEVLDNMETFSNIRINDFEPAKLFYNQTQSIRTYYSFNDVDVDRYYVNDEYTQVFLSAREINAEDTDDSWLIQHLKYTHGYGLTLSRVDKITSSGQPDMLIKSIPPVSEVPEITITRPEIYYGEKTDTYVVVNTDEQEFDYPSGEQNVYCNYQGTGGIELNFFNRILFSIKEQSLKLLISNNVNSDSRIMIYRNIANRIAKIAPFLVYDDDPYVVTVDGKVYWIADAYTASTMYPYSEPYKKGDYTNYIRNSVKIVVDAYNGDVNFYICDEDDPIVRTLAKIYPKLFRNISELPASLKVHLQYPTALFNIQAKVYERYHMTDVDVFYQNEDRWDISRELYGQTEAQMTANYFIMKLPGNDSAEFVSSISYSPVNKNNLTGILVARQDGEHYGELVVYRMPKDRQIYGTLQIESKINQDADISKEFALWNNSGSTYARGNMFVIPVEDSILYVEPVYLYASTGSLPEVKRVIVFYNEQIAYESTLAECLDKLFGKGAGDPLLTPYPIVAGHEAAEAIRNGEDTQPEGGEGEGTEPIDIPDGADKQTLTDLFNKLYENYTELGKQLQQILEALKQLEE
ncbi:MAG: UPF0182 family protein [Firmicutes bacterium]|nr:UPF0182 family protein [Bacillota bacterium]